MFQNHFIKIFRRAAIAVILITFFQPVFALELSASQAILIDLSTHTVLFEKNADVKVAPSSMSKIMTAYIAFEELKANRLSIAMTYPVSQKAWRKGGTKMFVPVNAMVSVSDLLKGIIIQSGNDASIVLAEGIMGSEEVFAEHMTRRAHELGAVNTHFVNATGWPDPHHYSTVRDLALIGEKTLQNFPEYYPIYKETEFIYHGIKQMNRNPLLYIDIGCDGLKTGFTDEGGYGLVASAVQHGRRLIMAINGTKSMKARADDAKALIGWGFSHFTSVKIFQAQQVIDHIDVWLGQEPKIAAYIDQDVIITVPRHHLRDVRVDIIYHNPLAAPIKAAQVIGKIIVHIPDLPIQEIPLKAQSDVEKGSFIKRLKTAVKYLIWGHS